MLKKKNKKQQQKGQSFDKEKQVYLYIGIISESGCSDVEIKPEIERKAADTRPINWTERKKIETEKK